MTHRERFLETLLFGAPDRIPFDPGLPRESTLHAWQAQGLDRPYLEVIHEEIDAIRAQRGKAPAAWHPQYPHIELGVSFEMKPAFEEKVIEHKDGHYIVQDWMGAITEISDDFDYTYIRSPRDFVTRKWHRFPVACRADWEEHMRWRFNPGDPARYPGNFEDRCARLRDRDYPLVIKFNGPFWQLREFCGMEGLCALLLEEPDLVYDMARYWAAFCANVLDTIFVRVVPDMIYVSEDMCFKEHPMISPAMTASLCGPAYRLWTDQARAAGVPLFAVDSDGHVGLLLPVWRDCGINCVDPFEVAAGNDIRVYREAYGSQLAFRGGIDKRAIAAGGSVLRAELDRIRPIVQGGGYIPSCDHGVPPDISWDNFRDYARQLAEMTGWLD